MENQNPNKERHIVMPVAHGETPEKSKMQKAIGVFLAEDAYDIKDHIVDEYIAPRAKSFGLELVRKVKEFILDNIIDIARTMLFGDGKPKGSSNDYTSYYNGSKVYYTSYYNGHDSYEGAPYSVYKSSSVSDSVSSNISRPANTIEPLELAYGEAERVRDDLVGLSKKFTYVPVADYYQLCSRKDLIRDVDWNYGWKNLSLDDIKIVKCTKPYKYQLILPKLIIMP